MSVVLQLEWRVMASLVTEPALRFIFDAIELEDFTDFRCRVWFKAFRALQAAGEHVDALAILDRVEATDAQLDLHAAENANGAYLAHVLLATQPYKFPSLALFDAGLLHTYAQRRALQVAA